MVSAEDLLPGVMHVESRGKPDAVSPKGAIGLYQIMPTTGAMYGVSREALFHPEVNRMVATRYLDSLLQRYKGDVRLALAAYNTGPGNVDRGIFPAETRAYVRDVLSAVGSRISSELPGRAAPERPRDDTVTPWTARGYELAAYRPTSEVAEEPEPEAMGGEEEVSTPVNLPSFGRATARPVRPRAPALGLAQPGFLRRILAMINEDKA